MNLFKSYTFSWQEIGIFKVALLAIGIIIGAYWPDFFRGNLTLLVVIALVAGAYSWYVAIKQNK